jgi:hypothetical protein
MKKGWRVLVVLALAASSLGILGATTKKGTAVKPKVRPKRVVHVVCFKFKEGVTQEQIDEVCKSFAGLKDKIPGIIRYQAGTNISPENLNKGFTHCFVVTFKDVAARDKYLPHPAHTEFAKSLKELLGDVFVIDIETE